MHPSGCSVGSDVPVFDISFRTTGFQGGLPCLPEFFGVFGVDMLRGAG
jgi:hypothetical protein